MPDTVEHRVEMFQVTQERLKAGKPVWDRHVNLAGVFRNEETTFEEKRDTIVEVLRNSSWMKSQDEGDDELSQAIEELGDADNEDWFNAVWDAIYDLADADRVWISTT